MAQSDNHLVIMAGGVGSRFWPMSTTEHPKQFIDVLGVGRTLVQLTYDRFEGVVSPDNVWVVTNQKYVDLVHEQLPEIPLNHILSEPMLVGVLRKKILRLTSSFLQVIILLWTIQSSDVLLRIV